MGFPWRITEQPGLPKVVLNLFGQGARHRKDPRPPSAPPNAPALAIQARPVPEPDPPVAERRQNRNRHGSGLSLGLRSRSRTHLENRILQRLATKLTTNRFLGWIPIISARFDGCGRSLRPWDAGSATKAGGTISIRQS